jgi:hypothetical protein
VEFSRGRNRLFYQSTLEIPQNVTAKIINPLLEDNGPYKMTYVKNGLYYLDISFKHFGPYMFYVYEEDVKKYGDILRVIEGKFVIYPDELYI